jgi:hypothetical protein
MYIKKNRVEDGKEKKIKTSASVLNASVRSHTDTKINGYSLHFKNALAHTQLAAPPPTHRAKYGVKPKTKN